MMATRPRTGRTSGVGQNRTYQTGLSVRQKQGRAGVHARRAGTQRPTALQDTEACPGRRVCAAERVTLQEKTRIYTHFCCKLNYARRRQTPTLQVLAMPSADGRIVFPCTRSVSWIYPQNSPPKRRKEKPHNGNK